MAAVIPRPVIQEPIIHCTSQVALPPYSPPGRFATFWVHHRRYVDRSSADGDGVPASFGAGQRSPFPPLRPCRHGRQRHWNIGGSQVERRRRENRGAVAGEGVGSVEELCPSQKIYEFFISKWCDMVHSGCVIFKIHVSHGL